jgi:hypothetical protein
VRPSVGFGGTALVPWNEKAGPRTLRAGLLAAVTTPAIVAGLSYLRSMSFRLDRTAFHAGTHAETEAYHRAQTPATLAERLRVAMYLNSVAFNFDLYNPPRLDRTAFSCRAHESR